MVSAICTMVLAVSVIGIGNSSETFGRFCKRDARCVDRNNERMQLEPNPQNIIFQIPRTYKYMRIYVCVQ